MKISPRWHKYSSIVTRISLALSCIVVLSAATMVASYWISDRGDHYAFAINLTGSLRMQSYRLGLFVDQETEANSALQTLEQTWRHPVYADLQEQHPALVEPYQQAYTHWHTLRDALINQGGNQTTQALLARQIELLDALVGDIQQRAEDNARTLRLVQVASLLPILLLTGVVFYWLRTKVRRPLTELTDIATQIGGGDFSQRASVNDYNELGVLANAFNQMSDAIGRMHEQMAEQIQDKTQALQRSNTTLHFLYDTAKDIIEQEPHNIDFDDVVSRLAKVVEAEDMELCLMTEAGDSPYLQIKPRQSEFELCTGQRCNECVSTTCASPETETTTGSGDNVLPLQFPVVRHTFPLVHDQQRYGVIVCRMREGRDLQNWQHQLIGSVADQVALVLKLQSQKDNAKRLSLAEERTVIARELHDSLAQALSYLKIQVARLDRAIDKQDRALLQNVSGELREGLHSAYRQLRELLSTFRLKIEESGLQHALQASVQQLNQQSEMNIVLEFKLSNIPLSPNEEIHLLQIVREASQNAIHHSQGNEIVIGVSQDAKKQIRVSVEDDGIGIAENAEKLNHYGLAIMLERGKNLGGTLDIRHRKPNGTGVYFRFTPDYLKKRNVGTREVGREM